MLLFCICNNEFNIQNITGTVYLYLVLTYAVLVIIALKLASEGFNG